MQQFNRTKSLESSEAGPPSRMPIPRSELCMLRWVLSPPRPMESSRDTSVARVTAFVCYTSSLPTPQAGSPAIRSSLRPYLKDAGPLKVKRGYFSIKWNVNGYTKALCFADVGHPFHFTALNDDPSQWLRRLRMGLTLRFQSDVRSPNLHTPCEKRPLHFTNNILHARGTTWILALDVVRLYLAQKPQHY